MDEWDCLKAGKLFLTNDKRLREIKNRKCELLDEFNATKFADREGRERIARKLFGSLGEDINMYKPFYCDYGVNIFIGDHFFSNNDCHMLDTGEIHIGNNVFLGPNCHIYASTHPIDPQIRDTKLTLGKPVTIGNSVWVCGNVVINPGVTIGDNVVIGSGSVVTKDIPSNCVAVGNPCKVMRKIDETDKKYWQDLIAERDAFKN